MQTIKWFPLRNFRVHLNGKKINKRRICINKMKIKELKKIVLQSFSLLGINFKFSVLRSHKLWNWQRCNGEWKCSKCCNISHSWKIWVKDKVFRFGWCMRIFASFAINFPVSILLLDAMTHINNFHDILIFIFNDCRWLEKISPLIIRSMNDKEVN